MARSKVLSARAIMTAPADGADYAGQVLPGDRISSFAARLIEADRPFAVVNRRGQTVGQVDRDAVITLLAESA